MAEWQAQGAEDAVQEDEEPFWGPGVPEQTRLTRAELLSSAITSRQKKTTRPARFAIWGSPQGKSPSMSLKQLLGQAAEATPPEEVEDSSSSEEGTAQPAGLQDAAQGMQEIMPLPAIRQRPPEQVAAQMPQATPLAQTRFQGAQEDAGSAQRRFLAANAATLAAFSTVKRPRARSRPAAPGSLAARLEAMLHSAKERQSPAKQAAPGDLKLRVLASETEGPVLKCWCEAEGDRRRLVLLVKGDARDGICPGMDVFVQRPWLTLQEVPGFPCVLLAPYVLVM